jgi:hypothetical protein
MPEELFRTRPRKLQKGEHCAIANFKAMENLNIDETPVSTSAGNWKMFMHPTMDNGRL